MNKDYFNKKTENAELFSLVINQDLAVHTIGTVKILDISQCF